VPINSARLCNRLLKMTANPGFSSGSIIVGMKHRWLILLTVVLALQGTLPRLHCLCHNNEVLLITAAIFNCCHSENAQSSASMNGTDLSCFRTADSHAVSGTSWSQTSPVELAVTVICLPAAMLAPPSDFICSIANATRGPPFLLEYSLGFYLLRGAFLS
jgi:hypothetical protein